MKNVFLLLICSLLFACKQESTMQTIRLEGFVFGTSYHITYLNTADINYQKSIDSLFTDVNKSLSTYMPTSDISKINNGDSTIVVDAYFKEVFTKSKEIYKQTNGYFDPTVGNLVNAWGFGPENKLPKLDSVEVKKLMKSVGFDKIDISQNKIVKNHVDVFLDFNSIAKGFGVDVIGRFLESKNIANYLVEIGGEIRARGNNDKGKSWKVAIEKPNTDGTQSFQKIIELSNQSMATSGNYRKFRVDDDGKKYVHTINPKTGYATASDLLSATVISNSDCADVDAYATAFMAMGFEKAKELAKNFKNLEVYLIYLDAEGNLMEYDSK